MNVYFIFKTKFYENIHVYKKTKAILYPNDCSKHAIKVFCLPTTCSGTRTFDVTYIQYIVLNYITNTSDTTFTADQEAIE